MKLFLIGGFLGSGKTTAIQQACKQLLKNNTRVAVVTNDQGNMLVDSLFIQNSLIPYDEVQNGCFCCNYDQFLQSLYRLEKETSPQIIFAEAVGSCTDIIATIAKPLAQLHPEINTVISVFTDASFLHALIKGVSSFSNDNVRYIFQKQIEEADVLILNKADLLTPEQVLQVEGFIKTQYPNKKILRQNSLESESIQQWLSGLFELEKITHMQSLELDYNLYGEGEMQLAWLDASLIMNSKKLPVSKVIMQLSEDIYNKMKEQQSIIGHIKYFIDDGYEQYKLSYTTSGCCDNPLSTHPSHKASVLINARVQTQPEYLENIIRSSIEKISLVTKSVIDIKSLVAFRPGFPKPTHRIAD